jgi:arylsulfatase A-like enzyme
MLERIDDGVGLMLEALERHGLARETLIVFTDDNGGDRLSHNAPLFHRKATLWEGGIRVPCLLRWPGQIPAGRVSGQASITMDLTATILAATGTEPPAGRELDGMDLLPILKGEKPEKERTFFWRIFRDERKQKAVRKGDWKYIRDGDRELLFNLKEDMGERHELYYRHQEVAAELRGLLEQWEKDMDRTPPMFSVK